MAPLVIGTIFNGHLPFRAMAFTERRKKKKEKEAAAGYEAEDAPW